MIRRMKECLRSVLINRQDGKYEEELDRQFQSYDTWIREKEKEQDREWNLDGKHDEVTYKENSTVICKEITARIVAYDTCGPDFSLNDKAEDVIIFTKDLNRMAKKAIPAMIHVFLEFPECMLAYGDEDEWNHEKTVRLNPWFKPEYSPDTLLSFFYFGNLFAVRTKFVKDIPWGGFGDVWGNLYDFALKVSQMGNRKRILHIDRVLYHSDFLRPMCIGEEYETIRREAYERQNFPKEGREETVSIIIPSRDHPEILENCLSSIQKYTQMLSETRISYEIIVVDNGSSPDNKEKVENLKIKYKFNYIYLPDTFNFSRMCNQGARQASGRYFLFLNDDIEVRQSRWLLELVRIGRLPRVGAVGAKLYYPHAKVIQHDGIANLRLGPVHKLQFKEDKISYYYGRNQMNANVLAVTGACLLVRREVFEKAGGFDEELAVAFNDVEFCFRLHKMGYDNVICNRIHLWHHESFSRGSDEDSQKQERLSAERKLLYQKHPQFYAYDPYFHPYLSRDILDTNYSFLYQYDAKQNCNIEPVRKMKAFSGKMQQNDCLMVSIEYAGSQNQFWSILGEEGERILIQGYAFVAGSNNACFLRKILLQDRCNHDTYFLEAREVYRPDLDKNLESDLKAALCGFSIVFDKKDLPKGEYCIGVLANHACARQKMVRYTNRYLNIT